MLNDSPCFPLFAPVTHSLIFLAFIQIVSTFRAYVVHLEPRHDTIDVEGVRTWKEEYVVALPVIFDADCALLVLAVFGGDFHWEFFVELGLDPVQTFEIGGTLFLHDGLKCGLVHACNRTAFRIRILIIRLIVHSIEFILPIDEVQVILPFRIHFNRPVLAAILLLAWIRHLILPFLFLYLILLERLLLSCREQIVFLWILIHF